MSKKETVEEFKLKLELKKKQLAAELEEAAARQVKEQTLEQYVYDVIQNPKEKQRSFLIVKIKYNLDSKEAMVVEVSPFEDKAAGLSIQMDKNNRKILFDKNNRKKEQK